MIQYKILSLLVIFLIAGTLHAQIDPSTTISTGLSVDTVSLGDQGQVPSNWKRGGISSLTFSQVSLKNWSAGGENSTAFNAYTGLFADYKRGRHSWENSLDMGYGLVYINDDPNKSDDKINLATKYGYQISPDNENWYLSALLDFKTQFAPGKSPEETDSTISRFMAPAFAILGIGIDYKPSEKFSVNYTPVTGKFTFVMDDELSAIGAYGVDPGDQFRAEFGSFLRIMYVDELLTNVTLDTRLELFANYIENFGNVDVNWQNMLVMKVNKVLSANFFTHLLYDDDIKIAVDENTVGPRVQFKSIFGAGLAYTFGATRGE